MRTRKAMPGWYLPLAVLGISGLGALLFTERGRRGLRLVLETVYRAPDRFLEWNETAQRELDHIQAALNRVADSLGSTR